MRNIRHIKYCGLTEEQFIKNQEKVSLVVVFIILLFLLNVV